MRPITPQQNTKMRLRMRLLAAVLAVGCLGGLTVRLFVLMLRDPGGYAARAADQQLRGATLPAARGEIYSADGTLLAASETCWTIRAAPREMADDAVEPAARALSEILELDYADTLAKFSQRTSNDCLLRRRVDKTMADAVRDWCRANGVDGIQIRQDTRRVYPQGDFMGGILGFTDVDNAGLWGLELRYNDELTGQNGRILTAKNAWGYDMPTHYQTLVDAVPGSTLTLTIDANIQHWLENALSAAVTEHHVAERGVGIVMDVHTGAVLAMSCQPDYDPNAPRTLINKEVRDAVNALTGEERSAALQKAQQAQWRNKAISDLYEPGSVFKLITASAALDSGACKATDYFTCAGKITVAGTRFRCANGHIHGTETFARVRERNYEVPVIFLTGHGDVDMAVQAMKDGAIDFIQKPINEERLLSAVAKAVRYDESHRGWTISAEEEKKRYQTLTAREKQILSLIAKGLINKEVSERLGLSPRTIEVHRQKGLHKLGVQTVSELVRLLSHIEENALS